MAVPQAMNHDRQAGKEAGGLGVEPPVECWLRGRPPWSGLRATPEGGQPAAASYICIRIISWYADVSLERTCMNRRNDRSAFCRAIIVP